MDRKTQALTALRFIIEALRAPGVQRAEHLPPKGEGASGRLGDCRIITSRCLYGMDMNPIAVELAKISLWLVAMLKGRPFSSAHHWFCDPTVRNTGKPNISRPGLERLGRLPRNASGNRYRVSPNAGPAIPRIDSNDKRGMLAQASASGASVVMAPETGQDSHRASSRLCCRAVACAAPNRRRRGNAGFSKLRQE